MFTYIRDSLFLFNVQRHFPTLQLLTDAYSLHQPTCIKLFERGRRKIEGQEAGESEKPEGQHGKMMNT